MRFEGKHYYFSQLANRNRNFINICYSHIFKNIDLHDGLEFDNVTKVSISELADSFHIIESLRLIEGFEFSSADTYVYCTSKIIYKGYSYKSNYVVCFGMGPVFPKFGIISEFILINDNMCLLILKETTVEYFDPHFFAYKVLMGENIILVYIKDLIVHDCMEIQKNCKVEGLFLTTRHHLYLIILY